jgi:uncharacterized YigZ family protein
MESDIYLTIKSFSEGHYKEKGSRFIAYAYPVFSVEEIKTLIEKTKKEHYHAKHHCYAYILGHERLVYRVNDDGEPSGTAGKPILGQINSHGLTNILIIVVRYFGGKLLGVSGLINAYKSAADSAIKNSEQISMTVRDHYQIRFPYVVLNDVMKVLKEEDATITHSVFDTTCSLTVNFRITNSQKVLDKLSRIDGLERKFIRRS